MNFLRVEKQNFKENLMPVAMEQLNIALTMQNFDAAQKLIIFLKIVIKSHDHSQSLVVSTIEKALLSYLENAKLKGEKEEFLFSVLELISMASQNPKLAGEVKLAQSFERLGLREKTENYKTIKQARLEKTFDEYFGNSDTSLLTASIISSILVAVRIKKN